MRVPFTRKRSKSSKPLMGAEYSANGKGPLHSDCNSNYRSDVGSIPEWAVGIDADEETVDKRKKGVAHYVRKLNCAAGKKDAAMYTDKGDWRWQAPISTDTEITRPVLITVKDGEMQHGTQASEERPVEKNSFVVGQVQDGKSSERSGRFGFPKFKPSSSRRSASPSPKGATRVKFQSNKNSSPRSARDMNDFESAQEKARRQRWRKGLEKSWKDDNDVPSLISGEESTLGYSHAGSASVNTDYTTENSSDDSTGYRAPRSSGSRGHVRTSPPRYSGERHRQEDGMWAGVAEDMGIIAGLLLADGSACVGSVAAITQETMVDTCRPQGA